MRLNPRTSRRTLIAGAAAAATVAVIPGSRPARAATPAVDPKQLICNLIGVGSGIFYTVQSDGILGWYRNLGWQTGEATWANNGYPLTIGTGWNAFTSVMANSDGALYAVNPTGEVIRYRYVVSNANTGTGYWQNAAGTTIGTGFNRFARVFGGPDGVIWCTGDDGTLYRCVASSTSITSPVQVGSGFTDVAWVGSDYGGVLYGLMEGVLTWWRRVGGSWQNGGTGIPISSDGWTTLLYTMFAAGGTGLIYYIGADTGPSPEADNTLRWMRLLNYQSIAANGGTANWGNGGNNRVVGVGLTAQRWAPLQGYANPMSVATGQSVGLAASTTFPSFTASVVRAAPNTGDPTVVLPAQTVTGRLQLLPDTYRSAGCGWSDLLNVTIPGGWPSGLYAIRMTGPRGLTRDVPFVVRPTTPANQLAVLLPTCTYDAYNGWGGHSAYSPSTVAVPRTFTLQRPSYTMTLTPDGTLNAELYSDLLLLKWLTQQGIAYDVYTDQDLQRSADWLFSYRGLVLGTHAEYVTMQMRQAVADFVNSGGRLVAAGGNAIYEPCTFSADLTATTFREPDGGRHPYSTLGLPESQILGVNYTDEGWMTFAPFQVTHDSRLLANTGLAVGDVFAATGYNNAGSGWEFDIVDGRDGSARPDQIIAVGRNVPPTLGANIVFMDDKPHGGSVFCASSLSFVGALGYDTRLSRLFLNAINYAIAPNPARAEGRIPAPLLRVTPATRVPRENAHP